MVLPDTGLFVFKCSQLQNNYYFHNSNFLIKKGKGKKKNHSKSFIFPCLFKKVLRNPQQPEVISNFLPAPGLRDWQSEGAAGGLQRFFGAMFQQISRLKRGQVCRQGKQSRGNNCVLIHKEDRYGSHHKSNINNNRSNSRRWQSCAPQLGWAVWGGCRREMLTKGLPDLLHCHGEHQLQHPARGTQPAPRRASPCSPPLPLTLLKSRRRFGVLMQQKDGKENVTTCLWKSAPCSSSPADLAWPQRCITQPDAAGVYF